MTDVKESHDGSTRQLSVSQTSDVACEPMTKKDDSKVADVVVDNNSAEPSKDASQYPTGGRLLLIISAIALTVFLGAVDQVSPPTRNCSHENQPLLDTGAKPESRACRIAS